MAVQEVSPERVIAGADSPVKVFEVEMKKIELAVDANPDRELVLGGNIARILGITS